MAGNQSRFAVLADIHANLPALEAVLDDMEKHGPFEEVLCPGDIIGYGPYPNEVIDEVMARKAICVAGNHELGLVHGRTKNFQGDALMALASNEAELTTENQRFLQSLSAEPYVDPQGRFAMVHGSFCDESTSERYMNYVLDQKEAFAAMTKLRFSGNQQTRHVPLGIIGHTHWPLYAHGFVNYPANGGEPVPLGVSVYSEQRNAGNVSDSLWARVKLTPRNVIGAGVLQQVRYYKMLFNPGSVGQPRDGFTKACYGIIVFDEPNLSLEFRHVEYDLAKVQREMQKKNFPETLCQRLEAGI